MIFKDYYNEYDYLQKIYFFIMKTLLHLIILVL